MEFKFIFKGFLLFIFLLETFKESGWCEYKDYYGYYSIYYEFFCC